VNSNAVSPLTRLPLASLTVAVATDVDLPSAGIEVGLRTSDT